MWVVKPPLSSVLTELYCYQSPSSAIWGSALCRTFPVAAQIWPVSDYGQNTAKHSSLIFVYIASSSCLLFLFRRERAPVSFRTCNWLSITLFFFFSLALLPPGFLPSFLSFLSLNTVDAHLHFSCSLFVLYLWLDFYCLIIPRLLLSCHFKRYLVL